MGKNTLLNRVNSTAYLLYQNKEVDGITEVGELMVVFQKMIKCMSEEQVNEVGQFAVMMMKELMEAYKNQDVLGMADCLMQKATLFVQYCC